ncbi:hypothetical protein [Paracoccus aestuariivivens]|uniref:Uncharacterized protein n=1 Tax=Paracoccus aestuariivivens TaxID=1820333 RepID=A0A6L6JGV2_9RHOB|nr:hypothetical protein [Paracoccus aestuariivivens]MTH79344.1 hypothetical protein [Paracoccus aestuariivivens]
MTVDNLPLPFRVWRGDILAANRSCKKGDRAGLIIGISRANAKIGMKNSAEIEADQESRDRLPDGVATSVSFLAGTRLRRDS